MTDSFRTCLRIHWKCQSIMEEKIAHPEEPNSLPSVLQLEHDDDDERISHMKLHHSAQSPSDNSLIPLAGPILIGLGCALSSSLFPDLMNDGLEIAFQQAQLPPSIEETLACSAPEKSRHNDRRKSSKSYPSIFRTAPFGSKKYQPISSSADHPEPYVASKSSPSKSSRISIFGSDRKSSVSEILSSTFSNLPVSISLEELYKGDAFSISKLISNRGNSSADNSRATSALGFKNSSSFESSITTENSYKLDKSVRKQYDSASSEASETLDCGKMSMRSSYHYFYAERNFFNALNQISDRLLALHKEARQDSLKAELALLNHNLPALISLPPWSPVSNGSISKDGDRFHHMVVRIASEEGVVLNSAERVPYLILVEVIKVNNFFDFTTSSDSSDNITLGDGFSDPKLSIQSRSRASFVAENIIGEPLEVSSQSLSKPKSPGRNFSELKSPIDVISDLKFAQKNQAQDISSGIPNSPEFKADSSDYFSKLRTAAIMLAQLSHSKTKSPYSSSMKPAISLNDQKMIQDKILKEMKSLEEARFQKVIMRESKADLFSGTSMMAADEDEYWDENAERSGILDEKIISSLNTCKDDPSAGAFSEDWEAKVARVKNASPYGHNENWKLISCIVKTGADLRQEQLALQLIKEMKDIWREEKVGVWVYYYKILITSGDTGLIETIPNTMSIHSIKKNAYANNLNNPGKSYTIYDHFKRAFGPPNTDKFKHARTAFMKSLAGYSLATYILSIRDRHNGNILLDRDGHLVHIDFGFMLGNSPGSVGFETAPFKFPEEYLDILGGPHGAAFHDFKNLLLKGFLALRKHADKIVLLVELMRKDSTFPCFAGASSEIVITQLKDRFQLGLTEKQIEGLVERWILSSRNNMFTKLYDNFQYYSNGIL